MSILAKVQLQYEEQYDERDESTLYQDLIDALEDEERDLWQKEADFDLKHRGEYCEKYGDEGFRNRLEEDIVRLLESD